MLIGGAGTDLLTGGGGQDRFVFEKGGGLDVILDFDAGKGAGDVLDLTAFAKVDAMSDLRITSFLGSAVVSAEGVTITLTGVRVGELAADDFLFAGQSPLRIGRSARLLSLSAGRLDADRAGQSFPNGPRQLLKKLRRPYSMVTLIRRFR